METRLTKLQKELDIKAQSQGAREQRDISGDCSYCPFCKFRVHNVCALTPKQRTAKCACAKAFNRRNNDND